MKACASTARPIITNGCGRARPGCRCSFKAVANATGVASLWSPFVIANRNAQNAQVGSSQAAAAGYGAPGFGVVTGAVDTSANQDLVISGQLTSGADSMVLEAYAIRILRKA
jgi:hypothetical protein